MAYASVVLPLSASRPTIRAVCHVMNMLPAHMYLSSCFCLGVSQRILVVLVLGLALQIHPPPDIPPAVIGMVKHPSLACCIPISFPSTLSALAPIPRPSLLLSSLPTIWHAEAAQVGRICPASPTVAHELVDQPFLTMVGATNICRDDR